MPVFGIAPHLIDEVIEAVDQRLRAKGFTHHGDPAVCLLGRHCDLWKISLHLVQDRFRPKWLKQASLGKSEQGRRKPDGNEHTRVENNDWAAHLVLITWSGGVPSLISCARPCSAALRRATLVA